MGYSGIYKIQSLIDDRCYVGSSKNLEKRLSAHKTDLKKNKHFNPKLQNFVNKHGIDKVSFSILKFCDEDELANVEQYFIDNLNAFSLGFNCRPIAESCKGIERSNEFKEQCRIRQLGTKQSEETKTKRANKLKNTKRSKEACDNISKGKLNYNFTDAHKNNISKGLKGRKLPKEVCVKMGESRLRAILQFDLDGNFIKEWGSLKEASTYYKVHQSCISKCCSGIKKTIKGFIWKYKQ